MYDGQLGKQHLGTWHFHYHNFKLDLAILVYVNNVKLKSRHGFTITMFHQFMLHRFLHYLSLYYSIQCKGSGARFKKNATKALYMHYTAPQT